MIFNHIIRLLIQKPLPMSKIPSTRKGRWQIARKTESFDLISLALDEWEGGELS
jgi:hypothetical protein